MLPRSINTAEKVTGLKTFDIKGIVNYINTDTLSAVRAEAFLKLAPHMSVSMELLDVHTLLTSIFQELSNVTRLGDVINVTNKVGNVLMKTKEKTAGQLSHDQIEVVYDLCALFILWDGEDATIIDPAFMKKKISFWRENVDFMSFFLIARELSQLFRRPSKKV